MIELNNRFAFHHPLAVDIQSILEISQLIHDSLDSSNIVRLYRASVYFPVVSVRKVYSGRILAHSAND